MKDQLIAVGDVWFVQLCDRCTVVTREVLEITRKTMLLRDPDAVRPHVTEARYNMAQIVFIERIEPPEE